LYHHFLNLLLLQLRRRRHNPRHWLPLFRLHVLRNHRRQEFASKQWRNNRLCVRKWLVCERRLP
jgi:hypothetical protein